MFGVAFLYRIMAWRVRWRWPFPRVFFCGLLIGVVCDDDCCVLLFGCVVLALSVVVSLFVGVFDVCSCCIMTAF